MIWGLSTETFTLVHVVISLVAIAAGFITLFGLLAGKRLELWTAIFLATTIATSVTGFGFPIHQVGPPHIVGAISLVILAVALFASASFARLSGTKNIPPESAVYRKSVIRLAPLKFRERNSVSGNIGTGERASTMRNTASASAPPASEASTSR